ELYGFAPLETRAVEPLDQLLRKGETSKEVYVLRRLHAADDGPADDALGLHFDLTVPFARYVLENAGKLEFPFRRYQIQRAWRGPSAPGGTVRSSMRWGRWGSPVRCSARDLPSWSGSSRTPRRTRRAWWSPTCGSRGAWTTTRVPSTRR